MGGVQKETNSRPVRKLETRNMDHLEDQKPTSEELESYLQDVSGESENPNLSGSAERDSWGDEICYEIVGPSAGPSDAGGRSEVFAAPSHHSVRDCVTIIALKGSGKGYVIEDFVFIRDRCRNGNMYLKCRNRSCKARAIISRLNYVSLAGSGHDTSCTSVESLVTYQCLGQIIPTLPADLPHRHPLASEELPRNGGSPAEHHEAETSRGKAVYPTDQPSLRLTLSGSQDSHLEAAAIYATNEIGRDSPQFASAPHADSSAQPRLHQAIVPIHLSRLSSKKRPRRSAEEVAAATSSRHHQASASLTDAAETNHSSEMSPPKKLCSLDFLLPLRVRQEKTQEILTVFRAFRDIRKKVTLLQKHQNFPPLKNDLILRAARGEKTERVPVWVMRQAGRYLPEFQAVRKEHDFFEICQTPELACEITLQPIARFDLDAAIIFSDILVIPQVLGVHVEMVTGKGLVFDNTLSSPEDLSRLQSDVDVTEALSYVFDAITLTRRRLEGKVPLIGFSGAPWTLMGYCIEGTGNSMTLSKAKKWLYAHPEQSHNFLQLLTDKIVDYLVGQVLAGAQLLQVFDSNVGVLGPDLFATFALPYLKQIVTRVKNTLQEMNFDPVPMIVFAKGAHYAIEELSKTDYDVIGLDWTIQPEVARKQTSSAVCLQGNLDPCAVYDSKDNIQGLVGKMLQGFGTQRYIANLGHGVYPDFDPEHVRAFIDTVHAQSEAINKRSASATQK